jgi:4-amino-4-deoxy-L-arabinose transferase-like glycosyltransferase
MSINKKILIAILFLSIVIRLFHISFPLIGWHSWRQADTASIARNFYLNDHNILYPQIEWRGNTDGFVESEFHIYPFIVSILYSIFGMNDMWGRIVSVVFAIFTIYGLYLLVRKIISEKTALWAAFIYSILPLNIYFTRAFMPESLMLMCSVFGIYFYNEWIENNKWKNFIFSLIFITFAALVKLPALYLGLPLLFLTINKFGKHFLTNWKIWLYVILTFIPVILWYKHAHNLFLQTGLTFSIWNFGEDKWGMIGPLLTFKFYNDIFFKNIAERHLTYAAFILFIWGLFIKRKSSKEKLFDWWLIGVIVFIFIAPQAHLAQEYYQLPFTISASVFVAKVFEKYFKHSSFKKSFSENRLVISFLSLALLAIILLSFLRVNNFMKSENPNATIFKFSNDISSKVNENDLIIYPSDGNPTLLFLSNRRGWILNPVDLTSEHISEKKDQGAKYIISEKKVFENEKQKENLKNIFDKYEIVVDNDEYFIASLKNK